MRVKIVEIEVSQPLTAFSAAELATYQYLQGLVRRNSVPVGYVWLELKEPELSAAALEEAIKEQLSDYLGRAEQAELLNSSNNPIADGQLPLVTVVVCTRNRTESLARCLDSLARLNYPKLDILVVDNASADNCTQELVKNYPLFRYVREPKPGLDWARNRGIAEARGEIIAYTDDDVRVDKLWVRRLAEAFVRDPTVLGLTGLVAPAENETAPQRTFENYGGFGRGFERKVFPMQRQPEWWYFPLNASIFGTGCNMAYRRAFLEQQGGFDVALDVGTLSHGGGDLDMFYRLVRAGGKLVYEPQAVVWHYHRREYTRLRRQLYDNGRGYYAFLAKCFLNDRPMRRIVLRWGGQWYRRWYLHRLRYRPKIGRKLVLLEAIGAVQGPFYYLAARVQARQVARRYQGSHD